MMLLRQPIRALVVGIATWHNDMFWENIGPQQRFETEAETGLQVNVQ